VEVEGQFGRVSDITLRTTRIRTNQNTYVVIPNKAIIDSVLKNYSKHGETRVDVPVGIAYKESMAAAREAILKRVPEKVDMVLSSPEPDVVVTDLGDSSVNLMVRVWIEDAKDLPATQFAVVEESKRALDEVGIEIPFPHLQLFVDNVEDRVWEKATKLRAG
ncbi:MAG: mechanosensitive ion channel, partial [Gemmatimonadetes bacterium]|nr:mechanosensitive ion channel [Gemmatimonadota bacterium]